MRMFWTAIYEWRQKRKLRELLRDPRAARGFRSPGNLRREIAADRPTTDTACGQKWRPIAIIRRSCSDSLLTASVKWTEFSEGTGRRELQLELEHLFPNVARRGPHLSGDAPPRHRLDARNRAQRVVPGARHGIARRRHPH